MHPYLVMQADGGSAHAGTDGLWQICGLIGRDAAFLRFSSEKNGSSFA